MKLQLGLYKLLLNDESQLYRVTTGLRIGQELYKCLSHDEYIDLIQASESDNARFV